MCAGCMARRAKTELIRIVCSAEGKAVIDAAGKSDGRGAYVCPDENCIRKAEKKNWFARNLKCSIDKELYEKLKKLADGE